MGGEGAHGILLLSPRAIVRLESYKPDRPLPKIFRLTKDDSEVREDGEITYENDIDPEQFYVTVESDDTMSMINEDGYVMVLPPNNVYNVHWGSTGTDWEHMRINTNCYTEDTDETIVLRFNHT